MRKLVLALSIGGFRHRGAGPGDGARPRRARPPRCRTRCRSTCRMAPRSISPRRRRRSRPTIAEASKSPRNWKLSIAVVDTNGDLVALQKMDQTQVASVGISIGKARTAARFRRPSAAFANVMATPAGGYVATLGDPPPTASPGGIPLVEGGKIIGAIGCSGATGAQDDVACKAGAETIK